jgi:hypothetical protein
VWQAKGLRADFADVWQGKELEDEKEVEEVEEAKEGKRTEAMLKRIGVRPFANGALCKSFEAPLEDRGKPGRHFEAQCKRSRLILFAGRRKTSCTKVQKSKPVRMTGKPESLNGGGSYVLAGRLVSTSLANSCGG